MPLPPCWRGRRLPCSDPQAVHEAKLLNLATDKAHHLLGWRPRWAFAETIERTVEWYRAMTGLAVGGAAPQLTRGQIDAYAAKVVAN